MSRAGVAALVVAVASCGPETTTFRTTDKGDGVERSGPSAAVYDVQVAGQLAAHVRVWSNGGYVGTSDEPMTHVGFGIDNASNRPIMFDNDALALVVFDNTGSTLPPAIFTVVTPLGPAQVAVAPGASVALDSYFRIPVRPRIVDHMRVRWALRVGGVQHVETTSFVRDDDYPVIDYRPNDLQPPRS